MLSANFVENLDNYSVCSRCSMGLYAKVAEVPVTGDCWPAAGTAWCTRLQSRRAAWRNWARQLKNSSQAAEKARAPVKTHDYEEPGVLTRFPVVDTVASRYVVARSS